MATTPHENAVRSYPDEPHPGTTTQHGGAKPVTKRRQKPTIPMRIVRIDTIPMTDQELHDAAEALAVLLNNFLREHPDLAA